jgi:hypothetical protein
MNAEKAEDKSKTFNTEEKRKQREWRGLGMWVIEKQNPGAKATARKSWRKSSNKLATRNLS